MAQENACRYCYGAARAIMRMIGYSEVQVSRIERDIWLTELDEKERAFIQFCRTLARSRPRPARAERERLLQLGYTPLAVAEMAFLIASACFYNRVTTFIACPPEVRLERFPDSLGGRLLGLSVGGLMFRVQMWRMGSKRPSAPPAHKKDGAALSPVVAALAGLPYQAMLQEWLDSAFASDVLSRRTKALIFAVVARSLECTLCEGEARKMLEHGGLAPAEIDDCLDDLESPKLGPVDSLILSWARDTVHFQTDAIQQRTRELAAAIGDAALLEAVGVAALANGTVRLAMLLV